MAPRPLRPGESLIIGSAVPLFAVATGPRVVSARFGDAQVQAIRRVAHARGMTLATYVNRVVASAAAIAQSPDPAAARANIAACLGLDAGVTDDQIIAALQALLAAASTDSQPTDVTSTPDAATAEVADPQPVKLARLLVNPLGLSSAHQKQWLAERAQLRAARGTALITSKKATR